MLKRNIWGKYCLIFYLALVVACSSAPPPADPTPEIESTSESVDELLSRADLLTGNQSARLRLEAIAELITENQLPRAIQEIAEIDNPSALSQNLQLQTALLNAQIAVRQGEEDAALRWLTGALAEGADAQSVPGRSLVLLRGQLYQNSNRPIEAIEDFVLLTEFWPIDIETTLYEDLWQTLSSLQEEQLDELASNADSYELRGWIELARVSQEDQNSIRSQLDGIVQWRRIWARHSAAGRLPAALSNLQATWDNRPTHIALLLPLQEPAGNAIQEGFLTAYYEALSVSREVPQISVYDSTGVDTITPLYEEAIANGSDLVIGPLDKELVNQIHSLERIPIPTLALNYADDIRPRENFFQFGLAPEDEIAQVVNLAWNAGYRNAAVIMPDTIDYERLENFFTQTWENNGGRVVSSASFFGDADYAEIVKRLMAIDSSESRAEKLLDLLPRQNMEFTPRRREDIDFIFLVANPRQGRQIKPTLAFYFAGNIPVFSMPSIYDGLENPQENRDLDGIIFTDAPWVINHSDALREEINANLRQAQGPLQRLRAMGIDSFRLYPRLNQLAEQQINSLRGTTGILTMSENLRIHRSLEPARFEDGLALPYRPQVSSGSD